MLPSEIVHQGVEFTSIFDNYSRLLQTIERSEMLLKFRLAKLSTNRIRELFPH